RQDAAIARPLADSLRRQGFRVFLDTSDIDPGDNFVTRLSGELAGATAVLAIISGQYLASRWAQAELYYSVARRKLTIPIVVPPASLDRLDQPLARLLADVQYVTWTGGGGAEHHGELARLLRRARRRRRTQLATRAVPIVAVGIFVAVAAWWTAGSLNELDRAKTRDRVLREVVDAQRVLQGERMSALQQQVRGDREALGELLSLARDSARTD